MNTWLELSTLARWCEQRGRLFTNSANTHGTTASYTNGVDLVPTRDGVQITGVRFYVPKNMGLVGKTIRLSLWDNIGWARIAYADFLVPDDGQRYDVLFDQPYDCEAYHNICITQHVTDVGWWLMDNNMIQAAIVGTQPSVRMGSLTQVTIGDGMWRCGAYFIAGDANPCGPGGTYCPPNAQPNNQVSPVDPILA